MRTTFLAAVVTGLVLSGCAAAEQAVEQVQQQVEETRELVEYCSAAARVAAAANERDIDAAIAAGETLVVEAPDEIVDEARTVLERAKQARDTQDPSVLQSEEFRTAAAAVEDHARDNCDPTS